MTADLNRRIKDFVTLFRDTWAECEAFRTKQRIEASGKRANWDDCLKDAQTHAQELFEPLFSAIRSNAPLNPHFDSVRERLEASQK
jgi:hypothetical protein